MKTLALLKELEAQMERIEARIPQIEEPELRHEFRNLSSSIRAVRRIHERSLAGAKPTGDLA